MATCGAVELERIFDRDSCLDVPRLAKVRLYHSDPEPGSSVRDEDDSSGYVLLVFSVAHVMADASSHFALLRKWLSLTKA